MASCASLNLKSDEGVAILKRMALDADVVVENFRPDVKARLGVDYPAMRAVNPRIVYGSISGFGEDGPYRDRPAYDIIVQAMSGGMSMTGEPGGRPVRAGIPIGDIAAGMYSAVAILAALNRRHLTGQGDFIDVAMLDCQAAMLSCLPSIS